MACQLVSQLTLRPPTAVTQNIEIIDRARFDKLVQKYDWNNLLHIQDFNDVYTRFSEQFRLFRWQARKIITVRRRRNDHDWLTDDILSSIKLKDALWARCRRSPKNAQLKEEFRIMRNRVNALIRSAKRIYFRKAFFKARSNISQTWCLVNQLRGKGVKRSIDDTLEAVLATILRNW